MMADAGALTIRPLADHEISILLKFIRELAAFERLSHEVVATEESLREALFGTRPVAEVVLARVDGVAVGYGLFFYSFSTFLGRPGLYLEDLYVTAEARGAGVGTRLLTWIARAALERSCGRLEWAVLDWNCAAIGFYHKLGALVKDEWKTCRVAGTALTRLAARDL